jgi:hypothetical protein
VGTTGNNSWGCEKLYEFIDKKPETDRGQLGRVREGNIKMNLKEVGYEGAHWIHLVHNSGKWRAGCPFGFHE